MTVSESEELERIVVVLFTQNCEQKNAFLEYANNLVLPSFFS